jgi:phospholipid N-methyltransferase
VGNFTAAILERLPADGMLLVIETNPEFVRYLRESFSDPRLHIVEGSAAEVGTVLRALGHERADYVISGIPFTIMPADVRDAILQETHDLLAPDGLLIVYQFTASVRPELERLFGRVERRFELLNVLPAHLFFCERSAA